MAANVDQPDWYFKLPNGQVSAAAADDRTGRRRLQTVLGLVVAYAGSSVGRQQLRGIVFRRIERLGECEGMRCRAVHRQMLEPVFGLVQVWSISGVYPPEHVAGTRRCFKPFASPVQCFGVQAFVYEPTQIFRGSG